MQLQLWLEAQAVQVAVVKVVTAQHQQLVGTELQTLAQEVVQVVIQTHEVATEVQVL
jgi:hypothetical protein